MFENLVGKKNLSMDRLATLCLVDEVGSIGKAAGGDANRQSQFSRQIAELESFLGIDLLDRSAKPYRITEKGAELARICRNYLSALDDFVGTCSGQPSKLIIGAGESLIHWLLIPAVLPVLKQAFPEARISFRNMRTEAAIESLQSGEIDIGFVRKDALTPVLSAAGKFVLDYRLYVPKKFRARLKSPVKFEEIAKLPLAVLEGRGQYRTTLENLATEVGVELKFVTECSSSTQVALLVSRKECCAILPAYAESQFDRAGVQSYEVKGLRSLERTLCFAWNSKRAGVRPILAKAAKVCATA